MGYGYGYNPVTGGYGLACDNCGTVGGVRKRKCPHTVTGDNLRSPSGHRSVLPYCPAPAVCAPCFKELGGTKGLHGARCAEGAAASQAKDDAVQALLDAGHKLVISASFNADDKTMTDVLFSAAAYKDHETLTIPSALYGLREEGAPVTLEDYRNVLNV